MYGPVILICFFLFSPANAYNFSPENPAPGAGSIYISYNGPQSQGDILAIDVRVNRLSVTTPAMGAVFDLDFDPSVLTYDSYLPGNFFEQSDIPGNGNIVRLVALQQGIPGRLLIGVTQNNEDPGASGSGTLLTLKFRVASGDQPLQSKISFSQMNLIDVHGMMVTGLNWYNGQVVQYPLEIITASFLQGTQGSNMTLSLTASGGFPQYTWNKTAGILAPGLSLNVNTGVISGTPSEPGNYPFTIQLRDSSLQETTRELTIVINSAPKILTSALPETAVNQAYHQTLSASGGTPTQAWDISSGKLPPGINLNSVTGVLSGSPTLPGTFPFTARFRDSNGASAIRNLSITVYQGITVTTASLPETSAGAAYNTTLQVQGGTAPYTWTIAAGLPAGLSLIPDTGRIVGIPSTAGNWSFTVNVRDASGAAAMPTLAIMDHPSQAIATTSVSNLYQDSTGQEVAFAATGGISPYTWSLSSGNLPSGLTLDTHTGVVSGTPSKPGKYSFTVLITDSVGITSATEYQWVILATPPGNVDFVTPGSVNRVDGYDLIALTLEYGTTAQSQTWNPLADFNGDQIIDSSDLNILLGNFGKSNGH